jgi:hypothetical protein
VLHASGNCLYGDHGASYCLDGCVTPGLEQPRAVFMVAAQLFRLDVSLIVRACHEFYRPAFHGVVLIGNIVYFEKY